MPVAVGPDVAEVVLVLKVVLVVVAVLVAGFEDDVVVVVLVVEVDVVELTDAAVPTEYMSRLFC